MIREGERWEWKWKTILYDLAFFYLTLSRHHTRRVLFILCLPSDPTVSATPDKLQQVLLPVQTLQYCQRLKSNYPESRMAFCAGGDGKDTCRGDSGEFTQTTLNIISLLFHLYFDFLPRCKCIYSLPCTYLHLWRIPLWISPPQHHPHHPLPLSHHVEHCA